jgi:hypothetical protein
VILEAISKLLGSAGPVAGGVPAPPRAVTLTRVPLPARRCEDTPRTTRAAKKLIFEMASYAELQVTVWERVHSPVVGSLQYTAVPVQPP